MRRHRHLLPGLWLLAAAATHGAAPPQPVAIIEAQREPIREEVRVTGSVVARKTAALSPAVAGLVSDYRVEAGDRVSAGDALLSLDPEVAAHARDRSRGARREIEARLADARRRLAEAQRLQSRSDIAETEVLSRRAAVAALEASLEAARAEEARQGALLARHTLRAPFAGVISRRSAELGEWVAPGDSLLELVATDEPWVDFQLPQALFPRVDTATPIELVVAALGAEGPLPGRVLSIVPVNDPAARTFLLRAVPRDRTATPIVPGMSARAILRLATGRRALTVPRDALLRHPDGRSTVWIVEDGDGGATAAERRVETGLAFAGKMEIRSGLAAGARVITEGNEALQPGQRVQVR